MNNLQDTVILEPSNNVIQLKPLENGLMERSNAERGIRLLKFGEPIRNRSKDALQAAVDRVIHQQIVELVEWPDV
jgi:hypothetical protein